MSEHNQSKNEQNGTFLSRVEALRLKTGATWGAIGKMIGLSRTMFHNLRRGEHDPSQRTLARLEQTEVKVGLRKPPATRAGILGLLESIPTSDFKIEPSDHDDGIVQVRVEFRRGSTPVGLDCVVPVKAPNAAVAAQLLSDLLRDEDADHYLKHCLPPMYVSDNFLNRLEPASFLRLVQAAVEMSLGANWRERVKRIKLGVDVSKTTDRKKP
jgi:transcriptional regulator with XRE-family HTH domain